MATYPCSDNLWRKLGTPASSCGPTSGRTRFPLADRLPLGRASGPVRAGRRFAADAGSTSSRPRLDGTERGATLGAAALMLRASVRSRITGQLVCWRHGRRRSLPEMLFAHMKRILRLGRLRLRGPNGAQLEFTLAGTAQNLRRLAKLTARGPSAGATACVA
ncbi:MAG: transposase [Hyphomicrobiaceae bacterium]